MIKFKSILEKAVLKNPLNNFAEETQTIELREDPLLGTWARINIDRAKRVHQSASESAPLDIIEKSRVGCFFCAENVGIKTPELSAELKIGKRLKVNGAILFPNLYPFAKYHAVCVITKNHAAQLNQISGTEWESALICSINYLRAVIKHDKSARFASINMNYMPPAAASIIHPHLQIICDSKPTVTQQMLYEKSADFYRKNKKNYFDALAAEDKERRITQSKKITWLAAYSPSAANELTGIFSGKPSLFDLSGSDIRSFANELSKIFSAYWKMGVRSANMSIFSSPLVEKEKNRHFSLHARIVSRPAFQQLNSSDRGFLEILHREPVVSTIPEELAEKMKDKL